MQKYFEKIKERSREEKLKVMLPDGFRSECVTLRTLETIVNQVSEEYATDTNVGNKDGWIPCSKRLPNTNGRYLVYRPHYYHGERGESTICYFDGQDTWHDADGVNFERILKKEDVTAWQPLPEPYKLNGE